MKVGMRLGFAWVMLLLVLVTVLGIYNMDQMQKRFLEIVNVNNLETKLINEMMETVSERSISLRNMMLAGATYDVEQEAAYIKLQTQKYIEAEKKLHQNFDISFGATTEKKDMLSQIQTQANLAHKLMDHAVNLGQQHEVYELAQYLRDEYLPVQKKWQERLMALNSIEDRLVEDVSKESIHAYEMARTLMLIASVVGILTALIVSIWITRNLLKKLGGEPDYTVTVVEQIAEGDLAVHIDADDSDESSLLSEMKTMRDKLAMIVRQVRVGSEMINMASTEIASGNLDLSSRTEQQAGALEETASSMEQLNVTVKQNAENACQASQLAMEASDVAVEGGNIVSAVVVTMESINSSAQKVVDIISVIDGIAFQTNILALNAAVEAARAGEQGRGFAVVASEVRNLAQRSASAAKEIKALISDSVGEVENGSKLVKQAGVTMDNIVASIRRVTDVMSEIAQANSEQSSGIEQVNQAIIQIDNMTQQNATLVEQAAASAQALRDQASDLIELVSIFKLDDRQLGATSAVRRSVDVTQPAPALAAREGLLKIR